MSELRKPPHNRPTTLAHPERRSWSKNPKRNVLALLDFMIAPDRDSDEETKPIQFSLVERDLILELYSLDAEMERRFRLAGASKAGIVIPMNAYDLDELHGEVAAVANHEKDLKLQKRLDAICRRIERILDENFPGKSE